MDDGTTWLDEKIPCGVPEGTTSLASFSEIVVDKGPSVVTSLSVDEKSSSVVLLAASDVDDGTRTLAGSLVAAGVHEETTSNSSSLVAIVDEEPSSVVLLVSAVVNVTPSLSSLVSVVLNGKPSLFSTFGKIIIDEVLSIGIVVVDELSSTATSLENTVVDEGPSSVTVPLFVMAVVNEEPIKASLGIYEETSLVTLFGTTSTVQSDATEESTSSTQAVTGEISSSFTIVDGELFIVMSPGANIGDEEFASKTSFVATIVDGNPPLAKLGTVAFDRRFSFATSLVVAVVDAKLSAVASLELVCGIWGTDCWFGLAALACCIQI